MEVNKDDIIKHIEDPCFILAIKNNKQEAIRILFEALRKRYYLYLQIRHFSMEDSSDIVTEATYRIIRYIDKYDPERGNFSSWIHRILLNCCNAKYRKQKANKLISNTLSDEDINSISERTNPDNDTISEELSYVLTKLEKPHKQLVELILEGYEAREIVKIMKLPNISTYYTRKNRVLKILKGMMTSYYKNDDRICS